MQRRRRRDGFKLVGLLAINAVVCTISCMAFPHFVGPIDNMRTQEFGARDPSAAVIDAQSPDGTDAYVDDCAPSTVVPGSMVINIINKTDETKRNVIVRYPLPPNIVVTRRTCSRDITVTRTEILAKFETLAPHTIENRALNYSLPDEPSTDRQIELPQVPGRKGRTARMPLTFAGAD